MQFLSYDDYASFQRRYGFFGDSLEDRNVWNAKRRRAIQNWERVARRQFTENDRMNLLRKHTREVEMRLRERNERDRIAREAVRLNGPLLPVNERRGVLPEVDIYARPAARPMNDSQRFISRVQANRMRKSNRMSAVEVGAKRLVPGLGRRIASYL